MEIEAENGVRLGTITWEDGIFWFEPHSKMTEYMLEQALERIRQL